MKNFTTFAIPAIFAFAWCEASALPADISVTPEPGAELEEISGFTINCGWLEKKIGGDKADLLINGKAYAADLDLVNYDELKFTLRTPVTSSGTYSVIIPENTFLMGWEGDPSPVVEFSYIVKNDNGGGDEPGRDEIQNVVPEGYTFSPSAGTEVPVLASFSVTATNEMFLTPASRKSAITVNGTPVDAVACTSGDLGNTLTWNLAKPINTPGTYTVYIPQGTFYGYSEEDNDTFLVSVKVIGGDLPEPVYFDGEVVSDPVSGSSVGQLDKIAVKYPKLTSAYVGPEAGAIVVTDKSGNSVDAPYTLTPDPDDFNEAHVVWLDFTTPVSAPGEYTISFPARCFEIAKYPDNWYSAPFELNFTVSDDVAIDEVGADLPEGVVEYFTVGGARIYAPVSSGIYLRRSGSKVEKIIIR